MAEHKIVYAAGVATLREERNEQGRHAHSLRMMLSRSVKSIEDRMWALRHEARDLRTMLEQERTPMGFDTFERARLVATLDCVDPQRSTV